MLYYTVYFTFVLNNIHTIFENVCIIILYKRPYVRRLISVSPAHHEPPLHIRVAFKNNDIQRIPMYSTQCTVIHCAGPHHKYCANGIKRESESVK